MDMFRVRVVGFGFGSHPGLQQADLEAPTQEAAAGLAGTSFSVYRSSVGFTVEVLESLCQRKEHHDCGAADRPGCGYFLPCGQGGATIISLTETAIIAAAVSQRGSGPRPLSMSPKPQLISLAPGRRRSGADEDLRSQRGTEPHSLVGSSLLDDSILYPVRPRRRCWWW